MIKVIIVIVIAIVIVRKIMAAKDEKRWQEHKAQEERAVAQRNIDFLNAVNRGDRDTAQKLLEAGADINYIDWIITKNMSALQLAVENRDKDMVLLLLEKGAGVNLINEGKTPLDYAEDEEVKSILKKHGAKTQAEIVTAEEEAIKEVGGANNLGMRYYKGDGVEQNYEKAVELFRKDAEQGDAVAQYNLGNCYSNGEGVEQNYWTAVDWYTKSAEQNFAPAQNNLGICYYNGTGVVQDKEKAIELYKKSAAQGFSAAQYNLGDDCRVHFAYAEAAKWFEKAAAQGHEKALQKLIYLRQEGLY